MSNISRYIYSFILGAVGGIVSEIVVSRGKNHCIITPNVDCILTATIANLYGWSAVILTIIFDMFEKLNFHPSFMALSIALFTILIFECVAGKMSYIYHGYQTWKYDENWYPICQNYVSFRSSLYFLLLIIIFYYTVYLQLSLK